MHKKFENYFLGLDIGTDSIGWAVTDTSYKLLRVNNKNMWGVRLFKPASTAAARRANREARRRLERRKWRIQLLQEIFAPTINAIDANFFARLDDSNLYDGDKRENTPFSLFNDANFTDRDFHRTYKTVYHLRKAMMTAVNPDPRLVYLALHHMIKYRGHFLLDWTPNSSNESALDDISTPLNAINAYLAEHDIGEMLSANCQEQFRQILLQRVSKTVSAQKYVECFGVAGNKPVCAILDLIAGKKVSVSKLPVSFTENISITFDCEWESVEEEIRNQLGEDYILVENAKIIYDYAQIKKLLGNHKYLSEGMVEKYEKHHDDLAKLKRVLKKYFDDEQYRKMFRDVQDKKVTNYTAYSGKTNFGVKKNGKHVKLQVLSDSRSYDEFVKYVKAVLTSSEIALQDVEVQQILADMESGTFMPKQVSKNNAMLPYQLNWIELNAILQNICQFPQYAFLQDSDNGVTTYQKILSLLEFRMPYYVGPTNNHSGKYWCVRTQGGKILPWNLAGKVDLQKSEELFIKRMTGNCPYVCGEKVLSKSSLLYEEYVFLNLIGSIKIDGNRITPLQKQKLSEFYATTGKNRLTKKILKEWLVYENMISEEEEVLFDGYDEGAVAHRRMYYNFTQILGSPANVEKYRPEIEKVIHYSTIAGKEKQNLRRKLEKDFPCFNAEQIKKIVGLTCNGWGTCSEKFLTWRLGTNPFTGETKAFSIIDALRSCNGNFMEIYNDKNMGFNAAFESLRTQVSGEITYDIVDELYCSPAVKKQIWQALSIVKEINKVLGCAPKKVFVEVARGIDLQQERRDEKNRSKSRHKQVSEALAALKKANFAQYSEDVAERFAHIDPQQLNNKKLYLYYLQNGKDIYTGEAIDYNHFELYDIDHIVPRSKIKDDSLLNNLVLTLHANNVKKADTYPVCEAVQKEQSAFWRALKQTGFLNAEKYNRLTRKCDLTENELADFINRQIVETQQSTKETIKLLKRVYPQSEIVWSKAGNVSDFRKGENGSANNCLKFVKCREINDLHHAKDAYLNIVVGNVYNVRYGHDARVYVSKNLGKPVSTAKLFEQTVENAGCKAWIPGADGSIVQVSKTMQSNAILFTHESLVEKGQLFNATICAKGDAGVPLKGAGSKNRKYACMADMEKYGGYDSEKRIYYMLVKFTQTNVTKKKSTVKTKYKLLGVTAKDAAALTSDDKLKEYCAQNGLENAQVLVPRIKVLSMLEFNGTLLMIAGMTGKQIIYRLAQQYNADSATAEYMKKVVNVVDKYVQAKRRNETFEVNSAYHGVTAEDNIKLYNVFTTALASEKYKGAVSLKSFTAKLQSDELHQRFAGLALAEQCIVLSEIAKSLQCNAQVTDLSYLNEGKSCGKLCMDSEFDSLDNIKIVNRSITGLFEQKIPLASFDRE